MPSRSRFLDRSRYPSDSGHVWLLALLLSAPIDAGEAGRVAVAKTLVQTSAQGRVGREAEASVRAQLLEFGFVWEEVPACAGSDDLRCLQRERPHAEAFVLYGDEGAQATATVMTKQGGYVGRVQVTSGAQSARDLALLIASAPGARPSASIRSTEPVLAEVDVALDARSVGRVPAMEKLHLYGLRAGERRLSFEGRDVDIAQVMVGLDPGARVEVRLRPRSLLRDRTAGLVGSTIALAGGLGVFAAGVIDSQCTLLVDVADPSLTCPSRGVELRSVGVGFTALGAAWLVSELSVSRRKPAWIPMLIGLASFGVGFGVSWASL